MYKTLVCITYILSLHTALIAQQQMGPFMAYGPEAKYFSNLNFGVYQSKNGYLWFGTSGGLIRFDGKRYKNYFSDYTNPNSPSDNCIFDIAEDKQGDLWFAGFEHGVTKYNQHTGKFTKYRTLSKDNNPYYGIRRIFNDSEGNLWFGTAGRGLAKYDFIKDTFDFYFPHPDKQRDGTEPNYNVVTDVAEDKSNRNMLWVGTSQGLFSFEKTTKVFTFYYWEQSKFATFTNMPINDIEPDNNGLLWLGTYGDYLQCFDSKTKQYIDQKKQTFAKVVYDLKMVNDSILYAACLNDGLYQVNIYTGRFSNITPPRNPADSASKFPDIERISVTPDAGIFIGGKYYVYQQHPDYIRLKKAIHFPDEDKARTRFTLNSFIWDKHREQYWVATDYNSGLYVLDKNLGSLQALSFEHTASQTNRYFYNLTIDAKDRVWVLQYYYGIYLWSDIKKTFVKPTGIVPLPDSILAGITDIQADKFGNIWMFGGSHFIYWQVVENKTETFPLQWNEAFNGSRTIRGGELSIDPDGNAWLFTSKGMFHCNRLSKKVDHIFKTGNTLNDLSSSIVLTGAFNRSNDLWLTSGTGLQVIHGNDYAVLNNYTIAEGLPSMLVRTINADNVGRIWLGTASGLCMFDPANNTWRLFNRLDGLQKDYLDVLVVVTSNNKIVIDQGNCILIRDINEMVQVTKPPMLHITSLLVNNQPRQDSMLPEFINGLSLSYDQNNIDIEFAAMDWVYPFRTSYFYSIDGVSKENKLIINQECKINLVNLQPGKYVLHIKALSGNGVYSKEISFPITIQPPFWKTWWFIICCILVLASILFGLYRYRINRFIEMQKVRNSISRDLHDEIGATLSSVNMLSAVALLKAGKTHEASPIIQQIKDSVQQAGESMDDIVWSVNPAHDLASDTFARIRKFVTEMTEAKAVNSIIEIDDPGPSLKIPMDMRRDIYLFCKEAVNNALKYSACTEITLNIQLAGNQLSISIADNGIGFDPSLLQYSIRNGIGNMKHRVEKHKGVFTLHSASGKGTSISCKISMPY